RLPSAVQSLVDAWTSTCQTVAIVFGLLLVAETQLLVFVTDASNTSSNSAAHNALLCFTYIAVFFTLSTSVSSLVLTMGLNELPLRASSKPGLMDEGAFYSGPLAMLRFFGMRRSFVWLLWHWLFTLQAGILCILTQILLFVWLHTDLPVKITASCVCAVAFAPLLQLFSGLFK
ncbi:hypothetical protein FA95DRAFT_1490776, partial [Auriscalpium vulgare]